MSMIFIYDITTRLGMLLNENAFFRALDLDKFELIDVMGAEDGWLLAFRDDSSDVNLGVWITEDDFVLISLANSGPVRFSQRNKSRRIAMKLVNKNILNDLSLPSIEEVFNKIYKRIEDAEEENK